jgi:hypothetical protein
MGTETLSKIQTARETVESLVADITLRGQVCRDSDAIMRDHRLKTLGVSELPQIFRVEHNNKPLDDTFGSHYEATYLAELLSKRDFGESGDFEYTLLTPEEFSLWPAFWSAMFAANIQLQPIPLRPSVRKTTDGIFHWVANPTTTDTEELYLGDSVKLGTAADIAALINAGVINPACSSMMQQFYGSAINQSSGRLINGLCVIPRDESVYRKPITITYSDPIHSAPFRWGVGPILITKRETSLEQVDAAELALLTAKAEAAKPLTGHLEAILAGGLPVQLEPGPATGMTKIGANQLRELQRQAKAYELLKRIVEAKQ